MIAHSLYVLRQVVADLKQEATPEELREAADEIGEAAKELYSLARDAKPLEIEGVSFGEVTIGDIRMFAGFGVKESSK